MSNPETGKRFELPVGLRDRKGSLGGFSADGKTLVTFAGNKVELWDWPAGTLRLTITVPVPDKADGLKGKPTSIEVNWATLSPDGRFVFINTLAYEGDPAKGGSQGTNELWDARTGKRLHQMNKPRIEYPPAAFAPDGRVMYLGGHTLDWPAEGRTEADSLTAWDTKSGKLLRRFDYTKPIGPLVYHEFGRWIDPLVISPDGRLLAAGTGHDGQGVEVYEVTSGMLLTKLAGPARSIKGLAFTPDSRRLVSVSEDQTGLVWDMTPTALAPKPRYPSLDDAFGALEHLDPKLGYTAVASLVADPAKAVPLLKKRLRPAPTPSDADIDKVIARLDADSFAERVKASADLERLGPNAVPRVQKRLDGVPVEARGPLKRFLDRYAGAKLSPYQLRCIRGVATLEAIGTAEARALLAELAKGSANDPLTRESLAATRRRAGR